MTGLGLIPLLCPFCNYTFLTTMQKNTKRLRKCPFCREEFFYYYGRYYVMVDEILKLKLRNSEAMRTFVELESDEKKCYLIRFRRLGRGERVHRVEEKTAEVSYDKDGCVLELKFKGGL